MDSHNAIIIVVAPEFKQCELAARCPEPDLRPRYADDFPAQARWDVRYHLASLAPWPFRHYRSFLLHHTAPAYLGTGWRLARRAAERAPGSQATVSRR